MPARSKTRSPRAACRSAICKPASTICGPGQDADILVVLGAPIGVYEVNRYPFLKQDFAVIEAALARGKPIIGICLGSQLLAAVLGARVYPNREKEIGWGLLGLTPDGARVRLLRRSRRTNLELLHWHGDTFDLPRGATGSPRPGVTPHRASSTNNGKVLALQFHVEQHTEGMERWLIGHTLELTTAGVDLHKLRADTQRLGPGMEKASRAMFDMWLDQVGVAPARTSAPTK